MPVLNPIAAATAPQAESRPDPTQDPAFQQLFIRTMLAEVSKSMPEGSLLGGELEMFGDILLDELAKDLSTDGMMGTSRQSMPANLSERYPVMHSAVMPVAGRVSSDFGSRRDPIHGQHRHHAGMDIAAPEGTPIRAALSGRVTRAGGRGGYGQSIEVEHADGSRALYAHCSRLDVEVGQVVRAGQPIAAVGSTGRSTGPHLHFELRIDGEAVDPEAHFFFRNP